MAQPHRPTTAQEIFNTVAMHLLVQGRKAIGKNGKCSYRAPNGDRCAVGILISDEEYSRKMEGRVVRKLQKDSMLPKHLCPHISLLTDLQDVHDYCETPSEIGICNYGVFDRDELKQSLRRVADDFNLECDVLAVM